MSTKDFENYKKAIISVRGSMSFEKLEIQEQYQVKRFMT